MPTLTLDHFIDGTFVPAQSELDLPVIEPATGQEYARLAAGEAADVQAAVEAAQRALPAWKSLLPGERATHLERLAAGIEARLEELAEAESRDNGKPVALARRVDIPRAVSNFRFFASAIQQFSSEAHPMSDRALNYTLRHPLGVVGCISPWNLPLYLFTWKIAPALAAGNCVVAKPSEVTPRTAHLLGEIAAETGFPPGVLNIVQGEGAAAGQAIVEHPDIAAISFTGGTATGARIARAAGPMFKKLSLELGGKNPNIVFADADFEAAVEGAVRAGFTNQGEICLCGSRLMIERPIYERFRDALVEKVNALKVGDPTDPESDQGALVSESHLQKVLDYIALAKEEGGTVLCGGERVNAGGRCEGGYFLAPTVIEGLGPNCRTNQEEIFGPVLTIMPFDTAEEALALANSTQYGLAAMLWTSDLNRAHQLGARLHSGIVWVNCWMLRDLRTPFGGMKASGLGREGGEEALRFFTEPQNICINLQ